jgi:hypothetical protein
VTPQIHQHSPLFNITNAAITPGTQPNKVRIKVMTTDPQPLSKTDSGGKMTAKITLINDILFDFIFTTLMYH